VEDQTQEEGIPTEGVPAEGLPDEEDLVPEVETVDEASISEPNAAWSTSDEDDMAPSGVPSDRAPASERLDRFLARRGYASRRKVAELLSAGKVLVNGKQATEAGERIVPGHDRVTVEGRPTRNRPGLLYFLLYKPKGCITGREDPKGRPSVFDLLPRLGARVEPVGRLDYDTEGALLLTNDGDLAHRLTHPSNEVPRKYVAKVWKTPTKRTLERLQSGIQLEDGPTGPCKARILSVTDEGNAWVEIVMREGRNRLVRRLFDALGHPVSKLRRVSFGRISIGGLERGQYRALTPDEVASLKHLVEDPDSGNLDHSRLPPKKPRKNAAYLRARVAAKKAP
jgi:23S rRNA pseudouridine2605 synthase